MAERTSKRRKEEENDGGGTESDRMSSLPDSVLCHILSFLPTETCVATMSLVSRRWRHLWEHLQVFDFYDNYDMENFSADEQLELFKKFAVFVNAVLTLRRSRDVRKMRLSCAHSQSDAFSAHSVHTWLRTTIGPHLVELHLALFSIDGSAFHLPLNILTCPNLVSLSLCGDEILVELERSAAIRLPSLKMLQLDIGYVNVTSVDILLSGCPILETLELSFSTRSLTTLRAPPSLKRLKFNVESAVGTYLEIDAPALKYLSLTNITFGEDAVRDLNKVDEAYLDVFNTSKYESVESVIPLLDLLRALFEIKHLVLHCPTTKWLFGDPHIDSLFPELNFPKFHYLLHLELILPAFNSRFLFHVLKKCQVLQALIVQDDKDRSSRLYGPAPPPKSVPNCLLSHLTFIHFKGFRGYLHELEFPGYVLRNGLVLKTMLISGLSLDRKVMFEKWEKHRILKYFSDTPRGSATCQLKFD